MKKYSVYFEKITFKRIPDSICDTQFLIPEVQKERKKKKENIYKKIASFFFIFPLILKNQKKENKKFVYCILKQTILFLFLFVNWLQRVHIFVCSF